MDNSALKRKASIFCLIFLSSLGVNGTTTTSNGNPTHLKPMIVTNDNNSISSLDNYNNSHRQSQDDTTAQESIKIENRQLYDTVKHASGYDPDFHNNNNNSHYATIKEIEEISNNNSSLSAATMVRIYPRKSAVIQAIPRKVRGPGGNTQSTTISGVPFMKPASILQQNVKDYGAGEPTTTIVYATSIPTSMPSRTFVNIRPVPLLSSQKYRSTVVVENERANHHHQDVDNTKPVVEHHHQQYSNDEQQQRQQQQKSNDDENHQEQKLLVLKKTTLKDESNSLQSTTTPRTQDAILPYQTDQQKRNPYKSMLYSRIHTNNEEITDDELPSNNRPTFYPNHKWKGEDYIQRASQLLPPPLPPASTQFVYENPGLRSDYYHPPLSPHTHPPIPNPAPHQTQSQNFVHPRYIATDGYQEEMYNPAFDPMAQQQTMHGLLAQQQQRQQQQYQPLTVRDFDLLLQLLVLREQRLHAGHQDPFLSSALSDFNCRNNQQGNNYYYASPKTSASSVHEYPNNFRNRELRNQQQLSTTKLLPSNVREELLFRMLLLALHLQPQTQSQPQPKPVSRIPNMFPEHHHHHNMYIGSTTSTSPPLEPSPYLGFRHSHHRSTSLKNPVRSVQVLGEID